MAPQTGSTAEVLVTLSTLQGKPTFCHVPQEAVDDVGKWRSSKLTGVGRARAVCSIALYLSNNHKAHQSLPQILVNSLLRDPTDDFLESCVQVVASAACLLVDSPYSVRVMDDTYIHAWHSRGTSGTQNDRGCN